MAVGDIFTFIKENPALTATTLIGGIGGMAGGIFLGAGSTLTAVLLGGALGIAGTAAGAVAGHYMGQRTDQSTPSLGGLLPIQTSPIQAGQPGNLAFRPTPELVTRATTNSEAALRQTPYYEDVEPLLPLIRNAAAYGRLNLEGLASPDGNSISISRATFSVPGAGSVSLPIRDISLPLRNGQIDQTHPEAKAKIKEIMRQSIQLMVPPDQRERANAVLDQTLVRTDLPGLQLNGQPTEIGGTPRELLAAAMQNPPQAKTSAYEAQILPYVRPSDERSV